MCVKCVSERSAGVIVMRESVMCVIVGIASLSERCGETVSEEAALSPFRLRTQHLHTHPSRSSIQWYLIASTQDRIANITTISLPQQKSVLHYTYI